MILVDTQPIPDVIANWLKELTAIEFTVTATEKPDDIEPWVLYELSCPFFKGEIHITADHRLANLVECKVDGNDVAFEKEMMSDSSLTDVVKCVADTVNLEKSAVSESRMRGWCKENGWKLIRFENHHLHHSVVLVELADGNYAAYNHDGTLGSVGFYWGHYRSILFNAEFDYNFKLDAVRKVKEYRSRQNA